MFGRQQPTLNLIFTDSCILQACNGRTPAISTPNFKTFTASRAFQPVAPIPEFIDRS